MIFVLKEEDLLFLKGLVRSLVSVEIEVLLKDIEIVMVVMEVRMDFKFSGL